MKRILALSLCILALVTLASCNSDNGEKMADVAFEESSSYSNYSKSDGMSYIAFDDYAYTEESEAPSEVFVDSAQNDVLDTQRKIIYTSNFTIQTKEYNKSIKELKEICELYGAWFESSNSYGTESAGNRSSNYTIRVPVGNYKAFVAKQDDLGIVISSSQNNSDVTEQYTDFEARLASAELREERVLKILESVNKLDDVLALERELADIRYEIESISGKLRKYDSLVSYSTVSVSIKEVTAIVPQKPATLTFGERLKKGFSSGTTAFVDGVQDFIVFISYNFISIIIWLVIISVVLSVILVKIKKNKKKKIVETDAMQN